MIDLPVEHLVQLPVSYLLLTGRVRPPTPDRISQKTDRVDSPLLHETANGRNRMSMYRAFIITVIMGVLITMLAILPASAGEKSRYMGGEVTLKKAPNGALVNAEVLEGKPEDHVPQTHYRKSG
jgi:hypothetical protein